MNESQESLVLAQRILDRVNCDPDDDLCVLARQLIRREDKLVRIRDLLTKDVLTELGSEEHEIMPPDSADEIRGIVHNEPHFIRQGPFCSKAEGKVTDERTRD